MKKKGSALVMMLIITSLLLVLAMSVLSTATSTIKTTWTEDRVNRTNLAAQSGISQGISVLKDFTPPNVPAAINYNILDDSGDVNNENNGTITFSYSNNAYTITSTANYNNYSKSVTQIVTISNNSSGLSVLKSLFNFTLGIINPSDSGNYSINFKSQGAGVAIAFNGPLYMSGNPNNFTSDTNASITINNDITTNQQPGINNAAPKNKKGTNVNGNILTINNSISFPSLVNMTIGTPVVISINGYTVKLINGDYNMTTDDGNGKEIIICSGAVHFDNSSGSNFNGLNIYSSGIFVDDNGNYSVIITGNNLSTSDINTISSTLAGYIQ